MLAFLLAWAGLLSGAPWLESPTALFGVPAGNLAAWLMAFSLPLAVWLALRNTALHRPMLLLVAMGALWLPASILLAGNIDLNFSGDAAFVAWLVYTGFCQALPVVLIAGWSAIRLLARFRS